MEIVEKVEDIVQKVVAEFEKKPIATTIKGVVVLWMIKQVINWFKK